MTICLRFWPSLLWHCLLCGRGVCRRQRRRCARVSELANGMHVIVKEDHRAPMVVSMVWYRAGSMDEQNGTTGVAHVLEHMMFKGTQDSAGRRVLPH